MSDQLVQPTQTNYTDLELSGQSLVNPETAYHVQFDVKRGQWYICCSSATFCCMTVIGALFPIICCPCWPIYGKKEMEAQNCIVDDKRIAFKSGWINKRDRLIPLDRVQDINIQQGIIERCCGTRTLVIQTAGAGGPDGGPEASLIAPQDPMAVRNLMMHRRDALVLDMASGGVTGGGVDPIRAPISQQPSGTMMQDLSAIRASVERIERVLSK